MNKTAIRNYAIRARIQLIESAKQRAYQYEITENGENKANVDAIGGRLLSPEEKQQRARLIEEINQKGYTQVMEEAAYTWFNRFIALRFMEVNGYLPSKVRVFTDENGSFKPEILKEAMRVELDGLDRNKVLNLLDKQDNEALYKYLLITQCNALNSCLPTMFEKISNWTELLFPDNLLRDGSVVEQLVSQIPADDFDVQSDSGQIEIIGWLYQYYISEKHEEVVDPLHGKVVKKEEVPAATQLFTTDWVVRYLIDNSVGRYWIERHPESKLKDELQYFVMPKSGTIKYFDEKIQPQELTVLDPCVGSGHFLIYAFDVLIKIYTECGYSARDAASLIIENNLFGLEIDDRAAQLAYFSVMMKARQYDRRFLERGIKPQIYSIQESNNLSTETFNYIVGQNSYLRQELSKVVDVFHDAKEYGSILQMSNIDIEALKKRFDEIKNDVSLFQNDALESYLPLVKQADILSRKFAVVATNPPYLNRYDAKLKGFVEKNYKDYGGDLFSVFMYRNLTMSKKDGYAAFMTPNVWMFIKTYEKLRHYILNSKNITTLVQMAKGAFFKEATVDICAFVLNNQQSAEKGLYIRLEDFKGDMEVQRQKVLEAIEDKECDYLYEAAESNFSKIPGSPIAYWVSEKFIQIFQAESLKRIANPRVGLQTGENDLFVRLWYEVGKGKLFLTAKSQEESISSKRKWFPYNKGGDFRKWYGNNDYIVNWENGGIEIKNFKDKEGRLRSRPQNVDTYFHECITWSKVSSGAMAFRYKPYGHIYDVAGTSIFAKQEILLYLQGFCNSCVARAIAQCMSPTVNYEVGHIANFPVIIETKCSNLYFKVKENIQISKADWDAFETSWDFKKHPLI